MIVREPYLAPYGQSLALHTDLYQLAMAYGYWKKGIADRQAVFQLFFRRNPFQGAFALTAGLETALRYIEILRFVDSDLAFLSQLKTQGGRPLFEPAFLDFLSQLHMSCDIDAIPEGTPVFPQEPLVRVQGSLLQAQLLESPLLNIINFQTLIATKAARMSFAAGKESVIEFGMRRAHGFDGALSASRAAYLGGCSATSNVLASKLFGIPVRGTHAHSWVMAFEKEEEAFEAFAQVMPDSTVFLVDTYDTLAGVQKILRIAHELKQQGSPLIGIRLDSGDLAHLSIEIRKILDTAGLPEVQIMASNELDEYLISDLKHQGAKIDVWGVGTHLVTAKGHPALDGVYKLSAIADAEGRWQYKMKLSEQMVKMNTPGILQVRRFCDQQGDYVADMIFDETYPLPKSYQIVDALHPTHLCSLKKEMAHADLLQPVMRRGKIVGSFPSLAALRAQAQVALSHLHPAVRRFFNPQIYLAGLEKALYERKLNMMESLRGKQS